MKIIKKIKHRVTALVMSFFLALGLFTPAFSITAKAEALPEMFESTATIADCVMTYYAMTGSAVTNIDWINTLYDSLGSSFGTLGEFAENGLMAYADGVWKPLEQLTNNIANTSAYTDLGLDTVFNVSSDEVSSGGGLIAATGAATLSGAAGCVATYGILPVLGGVTASYWGGIALGTIIAHKVGLYGHTINNGGSITEYEFFNNLPAGAYGCSNSTNHYYAMYPLVAIGYVAGSRYVYHLYCVDKSMGSSGRSPIYDSNGDEHYSGGTFSNGVSQNFGVSSTVDNVYIPSKVFDTSDERRAYINGLRENTETYVPYSPDMIGENGNLIGDYDSDNEKYTVPDMKPQIDPQIQSGKPLSLNDWLQFANGAQNNNNSISPIPNNRNLFGDIVDGIKTVIPEIPDPNPNPNPDPDPDPDPDPYPYPDPNPNPDPETVPLPDLNPYPDTYPVPDPDTVPVNRDQPQYTEKATENETDISEGDPYTTPDLLDKFPFCIPRDILRAFKKLDSGSREAPHIVWKFHPNEMIDYTFDVDFSTWNGVAGLLRLLELIAFIILLGIATRNLILS